MKFCISSSDPREYGYQKYTRRSQRRTQTHQNRRLQKRNDFSHLEMKNIIVDKSMTEKLREIDRLAKESMVFKNKAILLLDDVATTGNSMKACTEILLKNGAKRVSKLAIWKAGSRT